MYRPNQKYSYISHPQNMPLELNGSSKKKKSNLNRQDYKQAQGTLNEQSKSILLKKLSKGKNQCQLVKSVLPGSQRRRESRPSSVRIYKENKENINGSGIDYLMQKTTNAKYTVHKEKAHLHQSYVEPDRAQGKKHFVIENSRTYEDEEKRPVHRRETQNTKISRDLYSNVYRFERQSCGAKKCADKNLFKKGQQLGFEDKKAKKFSDMKMIEMVGSQHVHKEKKALREKRQDWRVSNVNFF